MTRDEFYSKHTILYFIIAGIGAAFCFVGCKLPVYDEATAQIIKPYSLPFIIIGAILIILSFLGLALFCDAENDFLI